MVAPGRMSSGMRWSGWMTVLSSWNNGDLASANPTSGSPQTGSNPFSSQYLSRYLLIVSVRPGTKEEPVIKVTAGLSPSGTQWG